MADMASMLNFLGLFLEDSSYLFQTSQSGCLVPVSSFWGKEGSGIALHFILPLPTF